MARADIKGTEVHVYDSHGKLIGYGGVSQSAPLSNFHRSDFQYLGHKWKFGEAAIMYEKALCFGDTNVADLILRCNEPKDAKRLGRMVKNFQPDKWILTRDTKVPEILYAKFSQNEKIKNWLLSTGDAMLAEIAMEDSNHRIRYKDPIWGITIGPHHGDITRPHEWHKHGENFLGRTLMLVRERIRNEAKLD